jgi:stage III sporulation protein AG
VEGNVNVLSKLLNKFGKDKILIILLIGIIMLVISIPTSGTTGVVSSISVTDASGGDESEIEAKLKRCLSKVKDVGEADVIVTYESDGKTVCGVIIVAKGGDNGTVVTQITEAVEALLGLPAHKIKVLKMS